jgi:hypothetical protein
LVSPNGFLVVCIISRLNAQDPGGLPISILEQRGYAILEGRIFTFDIASGAGAKRGLRLLLLKASKVPYTIVRSTQFFEFVNGIAQSATDGQTIPLSPAFVQPIVSDDVADALAEVTLGAPVNGTVELAGPERLRLDELVRRFLSANQDGRQVVADVHARYFGADLNDQSLTPGDNPRIAPTRFEDWLSRSIPRA